MKKVTKDTPVGTRVVVITGDALHDYKGTLVEHFAYPGFPTEPGADVLLDGDGIGAATPFRYHELQVIG